MSLAVSAVHPELTFSKLFISSIALSWASYLCHAIEFLTG
jgi:hypothetical protein